MVRLIESNEIEDEAHLKTTDLSPHLPHIFKNHVAVPVKGSHAAKKLSVVPTIDEHLQSSQMLI